MRSLNWSVGDVALQIQTSCFHCIFVMSRAVCVRGGEYAESLRTTE